MSGLLLYFSSSREVYRFSQQQFLNAIFAWNQDEVPQNSREAKKILQYKLSLALKQWRHLAVRVKPISFALRACFLGHYRMARMSQSASPCGLASSIYIAAIYYYDAFLRFPYKIQTSSYSGQIFAQIKRTKNIDSFEKK